MPTIANTVLNGGHGARAPLPTLQSINRARSSGRSPHPPLGMVLFVLSRIAKLSIERTTMAILPWLIPLMMSLIAITLIPELTLWLPRSMGMLK